MSVTQYPYERADKFNKGIRKLGVSKDGESYLDRFRIIITQIGGILSLVLLFEYADLLTCENVYVTEPAH